MGTETEKKIIDIIVSMFNLAEDEVSSDKDLLKDLDIWGDDAWDLLEQLAGDYDIDMSDFVFDYYFPCEGSLEWWKEFLFIDVTKNYKPIKVSDLVDIVNKGKWPKERCGSCVNLKKKKREFNSVTFVIAYLVSIIVVFMASGTIGYLLSYFFNCLL